MSGNSENLKENFIELFGDEVYESMQQWYTETLSGKWDYVVYVVRRSYILALLLEEATGEKMEQVKKTTFLTDASIIRFCENIADYYRKYSYFPSILLCDDILIHGRNVNSVISKVEKRLITLLSKEYPESEIKHEFLKAIRIHVFTTNSGPLILLTRYRFLLSTCHYAHPQEWHKLSSDISLLISRSNIANAVYVPNLIISKNMYYSLDVSKMTHKTIYQNVDEDGYVKLFEDVPGRVRWAYALRFIWTSDTKCNVVPFVFLPKISEMKFAILIDDIRDRLKCNANKNNAVRLLYAMEKSNDMRGMSELLTYIFSCEVLNQYCNISYEQSCDYYFGIAAKKLARHFRVPDMRECDVRSALEEFFVESIYESIDDLDGVLDKAYVGVNDLLLQYAPHIPDVEDDAIKYYVENFYYIKGRESENDAYMTRQKQRVFDEEPLKDFREELQDTLGSICAHYNIKAVKMVFLYLMQMMDSGVFSISGVGEKLDNHDYRQLTKAGEQALLILPLRMDLYIPFISDLYDYCINRRLDIYKHVEAFFESIYGIKLMDDVRSYNGSTINANRVNEFIKNLEYMGQKPRDWDSNYMLRLPIIKKSFSEVFEYSDKKEFYVSLYKSFIKSL